MHKAFLIAKHEYLKMVRKRSFLLGTLGMPLLIIAIVAISIAVSVGGGSRAPLGYVDHAGILDPNVRPPDVEEQAEPVEIRAYADEAAARTALEGGEIQAFYVVPEDYLTTGALELVYGSERPGEIVQGDFADFLRANLVSGLSEPVARRAYDGMHLAIRSADGRREIQESNFFLAFLPMVSGIFFTVAVSSTGQYMMRAVADEKENRTMEVLVSSLTPGQLIGGKTVGLMGVALTQLLLWSLTAAVGLVIAARFFEPLRGIAVPWDFILISLVYFLPSFMLVTGMMVAIGSIVTNYQEGQQISGLLTWLFIVPYILIVPIIAYPGNALSVFLTLFPTTAYVTVTMRWGVAMVPAWQLAASLALLVGAALFAVWIAARTFRAGMLTYGQRLNLRAVAAAIRGR